MADLKDDVVSQLEVAVYAKHLSLVAKVAELLAADEEYDAAWEDKNMKHRLNRNGGWNHSVSDRNASILRIQTAANRRASAIRAMKGEPPVG